MITAFKKISAPLLLIATTLTGCESQADIDRKPQLVSSMVDQSNNICDVTSPEYNEERLTDILMEVDSSDLDLIKNNNIVVCLDQRLSHQNLGIFDREIKGIFYSQVISADSQTPARSVLSLWDNGNRVSEDSFFQRSASSYGDQIIEKFASAVTENGMPGPGQNKIAGRYKCGKRCHKIKWKSPENFDQTSQRNNMALRDAPIRQMW